LPSAPDAGYRRRRKLTSKGVFTCERPERGRDLPPPRHPELLRRTSQCAFAVRGEMPSRSPTSSFEQPNAINSTTGNLAVIWYDSRADLGLGGPGDTDGVFNNDAQLWGSFSTDGGASFARNIQISAGTSDSHDSTNGIDYGDYSGLSFFGGVAHPAWSDNSNSTGTNPNGALFKLDIYTAAVTP